MSDDDQPFLFRSPGEGARDMELRAAEGKSGTRRFAERVLDVHTDERAWRRGAVGEEKVGRTLSKLPTGWAVVHDLTIGSRGANLDHLGIGPPGVFTLNTKNLTGKVTVGDHVVWHNGSKTRYLAEARREAERVATALTRAVGRDVAVRAVIVLAGNADLQVKGRPGDVTILHRLALRRWLRKQPGSLDPRMVHLLEGAARAAATWAPRPVGASRKGAARSAPVRPSPAEEPRPPVAVTDGGELVLQPWRRFGHDRVYVNTADGTTLGYLDRVVGSVHVDVEQDRPRVEATLRATGLLPG